MLKKITFFIALCILSIFIYLRFENYEPKVLKQIQEIKGISKKNDMLPYPINSIKVSETRSENEQHVTFKNENDYKEIGDFYKNILLGDNWKIEVEDTNNIFNIIEFKKGIKRVKVISTVEKENGYTIISLEVINL